MPEMVPRNCHLGIYHPVDVPDVDVDDEIIAYCSPDSTYAVTKRLLDGAKKSIVIGIYDFSAAYMKELLLDALRRGVKIKLMLDIDSKDEQTLFDDLNDSGVDGVPAPSCASHRVHIFSSSHEKVIVVDDEWCLVQSGNYSENSIPFNVKDGGDRDHFRPGNRDTGLAIRSKKLSKFFTTILEKDMALELAGPEALPQLVETANAFLIERAPTKVPTTLFPSKSFKLTKPLNIQPVLSPDNYMKVIPGKLKAATKIGSDRAAIHQGRSGQYFGPAGSHQGCAQSGTETRYPHHPGQDLQQKRPSEGAGKSRTAEAGIRARSRQEYSLHRHDAFRPLPQQDGFG